MIGYDALFWKLSPETQAALMQYQWDQYGEKLNIPPEPKEPVHEIPIHVDEDIDKFMRQAPSRSRSRD